MKLEEQCCSLELAKRLKELGVKQDSLFYWVDIGSNNPWICCRKDGHPSNYEKFEIPNKFISSRISAFNVAELLLLIESSSNEWACGYDDSSCSYRFVKGERGCGSMMQGFGGKSIFNSNGYERNFTDALASWVVYLIQNKLIEVSKLKNKGE